MDRATLALALSVVAGCGQYLPPADDRANDEPDRQVDEALPARPVDAPTGGPPAAPDGDPPPAAVSPRLVFVTSMELEVSKVDGVGEADRLCQERAEAGDPKLHGRAFKAWLSSGQSSPANRFAAAKAPPAPYVRLDDVVVAQAFSDLVDGTALRASISVDENRALRAGGVWTGTRDDGTSSGNDCEGWTATSAASGTMGAISVTPGAWSALRTAAPCSSTGRLYCFED